MFCFSQVQNLCHALYNSCLSSQLSSPDTISCWDCSHISLSSLLSIVSGINRTLKLSSEWINNKWKVYYSSWIPWKYNWCCNIRCKDIRHHFGFHSEYCLRYRSPVLCIIRWCADIQSYVTVSSNIICLWSIILNMFTEISISKIQSPYYSPVMLRLPWEISFPETEATLFKWP